jgi:hypothetical protein
MLNCSQKPRISDAVKAPACRQNGGVTVGYSIPVAMDAQLVALAARRGVTVADLVRHAVGLLIAKPRRAD